MTRLLQSAFLLAVPHGGQRTARRNARTPVDRYGDGQPVRNSRTASAASTTANNLRRVASD